MSLWSEYKRAYSDAHNWLAIHWSPWWTVAAVWDQIRALDRMMREQLQ